MTDAIWNDLAARCEQSDGKNTLDLSDAIFDALGPGRKPGTVDRRFAYSIDAITALIERELPGRDVHSGTFQGRANAMIMNADGTHGRWLTAATEPLARCLALAHAKAVQG